MTQHTSLDLSLQAVGKRYPSAQAEGGVLQVLTGVDLEIPAGQFVSIVGASGCGKSTLLRHIIGLSRPQAGHVLIGDNDLFALPQKEFRRMRRNMGVLFQDGALLGALSLVQNVTLPLTEHLNLPKKLVREAGLRVLRMVGLEDFADFYPNQLSGGMRKRAGLARAIVAEPRILLCDEPTSGLDPITAARMDELLLAMRRQYTDMSVVVVSHDLASLRAIADHVLVLGEGRALFSGSLAELEANDDPYLRQFLLREPGDTQAAMGEAPDPAVRQALDRWLAS